jgi:hypothetical protein
MSRVAQLKFRLSKDGSLSKTLLHNIKYKYHYQFNTLLQQEDVEGKDGGEEAKEVILHYVIGFKYQTS